MSRSIFSRQKIVPLAGHIWERGDRAWDRGHLGEAERLFKSAAAMGNVDSMNSLATLIDDLGRSVEARIWYKRAVVKGHAMAAWNLAMHYVPLGQKRWYRHWLLKAAAMGDEDAAIEAAKLAKNPEYMTQLSLED
jgi:Flp pilus assembly protein TadD